MRRFVIRATSNAGSTVVAVALVRRDNIRAGVLFHFFVPDMNTGAEIVVEDIRKNNVVVDALLDEDAVAAVTGAGVEERCAINRMRVEVDAVGIVADAIIRNRVNTRSNMGPNAPCIVAINIATVYEHRVVFVSPLGIDPIARTGSEVNIFDNRDAALEGIERMVGLAATIQFSARNRGVASLWQHDHLPYRLAANPWRVERQTKIRQNTPIQNQAGVRWEFQPCGGFGNKFPLQF